MIAKVVNVCDLPREDVERMGSDFCQAAGLDKFDYDLFVRMVQELIDGGHGAMFVALHNQRAVGGIGVVISICPFDGKIFGEELFWYIDPEHRQSTQALKLFRAAEDWARQSGARRMLFGCLSCSPQSVVDWYKRQGYREIQRTFSGAI